MKCYCQLGDLKNAIIAVSKALPAKAQVPILSGIYIATEHNSIEVQATDFSLGIIATIPADTKMDGSTVLPGKDIIDIINSLKNPIICISDEDDRRVAVINSGEEDFSITTMNPDEFPKVSTQQEVNQSFTIKNKVLKKLIQRSTFACTGINDSRPIFKGCALTVKDSVLTLVATNTHRLAVVKTELEDIVPNEINCVVPAKTLNDLIGMIDYVGEKGSVKIDISENQIAFTIDNFFVSCRLIDGTFPSYDKVIPATTEISSVVDIREFRDKINHAALISRFSEYHTVRFICNESGIDISAESYDRGKYSTHIDARREGSKIDISFNIDYFQDFLKIFPDGELRISMNEPLSPATFSFDEEENFIYIITPLRTQ